MNRKMKLKWCPASDVAFDAVPFFDEGVQAGFPSPAEDHLDLDLDLNSYLVQHPSATFCCRVEGDSMVGAGIQTGDVIMIDQIAYASEGQHRPGGVRWRVYCKARGYSGRQTAFNS